VIYPLARLPDSWVETGKAEGAYVDFSLKSPWQLFGTWEGDDPQGFIGLLLRTERVATIRGWYVFPPHRGKGIGGELLIHARDWALDSGREVVEIRTALNVEWAGFEWTGYERAGGAGERLYRLEVGPLLALCL
jgi:GNAT superfamily N-acetyltransferase